jgi:hypothetical protein
VVKRIGSLVATIESPPSDDFVTPFTASVSCEHGKSRLTWTRVCKEGCQTDPFKNTTCTTVSPTLDQVRHGAVVQHDKRYKCACCSMYWAQLGPIHEPHLTESPAICGYSFFATYVEEGPVRGEERDQVLESLRIERQFKRRGFR